ncbi:hypothetical protein MMC24_007192 [Lignoscripta atroalba]|nr:hypothetical protein [Lignoscripta atroalba]
MGFLSDPKVLYYTRIVQALFAVAIAILVVWCATYDPYWRYKKGAIALGVISAILTFVVAGHGIRSHHRGNPLASNGKRDVIARIALEVFMTIIWIVTVAYMLKGLNRYLPRLDKWDVSIGFTFVEIFSFIFSAVLVFIQNRTTKSSEGTNHELC